MCEQSEPTDPCCADALASVNMRTHGYIGPELFAHYPVANIGCIYL